MNSQDIEREIQIIPGNSPVLAKLYKLLESGEAIALIGAGASAGLWPLWNEFLQGFIEYALKYGKIKKAEAKFLLKEAPQTPLETAQQLRNKIGEQLYFEYLQETFRDKTSPHTGGAFTLAHRALMQLPIHNYLALNYDAGLTNARAALYPKATTSYYFWDQGEARRIRDRNYKRQVMHAHGRHDRADSIILTLEDYRKAYSNRAFVRLLDDIFAFEKLLIVGFGMSDPYIKQLFNNISGDYKKSPLRHVAFVGLDDKELPVTHLLRERVGMVYGAHILFYPTRNHHQALTDWLTMLAEKYATASGSRTAEEVQLLFTPPQLKITRADKYMHQPTDDANFKGRAQDFATLNRWGNDPATRTIAVIGIGGQGKTALVGRWLKQKRTPELARIPVFYWSFYQDLDVNKFLEQMVEFCLPIVDVPGTQDIEPISFILEVVRQVRLLLVLDGLEVLQEEASSPAHGRVNHPLLEQLLQQWLRYPHQGLIILTSRFRFPQLARYSGVGFHHLNLERLSALDGIVLLETLGLRGKRHLLETYVEKLHGHPLALRVLASTVKRCCYGDLAQFEGGQILIAESEEDRLSKKLENLLGFYERQLKDGQKELLGIISLFKRPVEAKSFVTLLGKMKSLENTPLAKAKAIDIEKQIELLCDDFLVEKTKEGITTHPVIRDYFRKGLKIVGSRREVADFLQARPGVQRPQTIEEVRDFVEAVQLLCDGEEFKAADDLYNSRLAEGGHGFDIFQNLPAMAEGLECDLAFVGDEARIQQVEKVLGKSRVAFHYSGVSLSNCLLGNLTQALQWRYKTFEIRRQLKQKHGQATELEEISLIQMAMGNIRQAQDTAFQALSLLHGISLFSYSTFAYKGYYEFLLGNSSQAYHDFEIALYHSERQHESLQRSLFSIWGNHQAEFLLRLQAWEQFEEVNMRNIEKCKTYHWNDKLAICYLLQGWSDICRGQLSQAEKALVQAEHILRPSSMVEYMCRLDRVWALLAEAKGEYHQGLLLVNDTLLTCADKGFRLWQADCLVLRGRLHLLQFQKEDQKDNDLLEKAGDDGRDALKIAEQAGYIWAKVEALKLLSSYHQSRATPPALNAESEKDFAQRYAKEAASLKARLFLTEKQMQELKAQARKEFDRQTSGWDK